MTERYTGVAVEVEGGHMEDLRLELPDLPENASAAAQELWRERFTAMYAKYYPEGLATVPLLLHACRGQEEVMMAALVAKYGEEPVVTLQAGFLGVASSPDSTSAPPSTPPLRPPWTDALLRREVVRQAKAAMKPFLRAGVVSREEARDIIRKVVGRFMAIEESWEDPDRVNLTNAVVHAVRSSAVVRGKGAEPTGSDQGDTEGGELMLSYLCDTEEVRGRVRQGEPTEHMVKELLGKGLEGLEPEGERAVLVALAANAVRQHLTHPSFGVSPPAPPAYLLEPLAESSPSPRQIILLGDSVLVAGLGPGIVVRIIPPATPSSPSTYHVRLSASGAVASVSDPHSIQPAPDPPPTRQRSSSRHRTSSPGYGRL